MFINNNIFNDNHKYHQCQLCDGSPAAAYSFAVRRPAWKRWKDAKHLILGRPFSQSYLLIMFGRWWHQPWLLIDHDYIKLYPHFWGQHAIQVPSDIPNNIQPPTESVHQPLLRNKAPAPCPPSASSATRQHSARLAVTLLIVAERWTQKHARVELFIHPRWEN